MTYNGQIYRIKKIKETEASNGITKYVTILWTDGSISCDCKGWCIKKGNKQRTCKHCKKSEDCNYADMQTPSNFLGTNIGVVDKQPNIIEKRMVEL